MYTNTLTLANGVEIPQLGLGTWLVDDGDVADAVKAAVKLGYRHIDTAQAYGNERGVGEEIRTCGIQRDKLFVVSKVAAEHKTYEEAKKGIDETLSKMGLDYLDMMIIHSPQPWVDVNQSEDRYVEGNRAAWRALEEACKAGKLRVIGVSNFQIEDLKSLMEVCEIKPMVNQILLHISNTPLELVEYCQKNGIAVEAYSPIGHGEILHEPEIEAMAVKYNVSVPQLCIRYTLQLGTISLPKTANPAHMESNAQVDFEISAEDMELTVWFELFVEVYGIFEDFPSVKAVKDAIYYFEHDYAEFFMDYRVREKMDPILSFATDIVMKCEDGDNSYLYEYGEYIGKNELETEAFLRRMSSEKVASIARTYTEGFRQGFVAAGIDMSKKKHVNIRYSIGMERIVKAAILQFRDMGLEPLCFRYDTNRINRIRMNRIGYMYMWLHGYLPDVHCLSCM